MKPYVIPIFIPHLGCPHQCVFCDQTVLTGNKTPVAPNDVAAIIADRLATITRPRLIEVAYYGGSFTCISAERQEALLQPAFALLRQGVIAAIRVSTRPDAIDGTIINRLLMFGVSTVEIGAQSLDDRVLSASGRGHTSAQTAAAVQMIRSSGLKCGLQLMPGLPGEDWESLITTTQAAVRLAPDFARIYPTVVLGGTRLAALYAEGRYQPLSLRGAVTRCAYMRLALETCSIPVIRTGLQATEDLTEKTVLAGPYHPAFGAMVESFWFDQMVSKVLAWFAGREEIVPQIHFFPRDESKVRGNRNSNVRDWKTRFGLHSIGLVPDGDQPGAIAVEIAGISYFVNKSMLLDD